MGDWEKGHFSRPLQKGDGTTAIPIPGLAVGIPKIGDAGVNVMVGMQGNAEKLSLQVGLDACLQLAKRQVCGSSLPVARRMLPLWVLRGEFSFGDICSEVQPQVIV